jgi:hypothetical protein
MIEDTALATMQRSLNEAREAKRKLQVRLQEIETESLSLRAQLGMLDVMVEQTETTIRNLLFPGAPVQERPLPPNAPPSTPPNMPAPNMPSPPPMMSPEANPFAHRMNAHFEDAPIYQNPANYQPAHYQNGYGQNPIGQNASYGNSFNNGYHNGFNETYNDNYQTHAYTTTPDIDAAIAEAKNSEQGSNIRFNDFRIPQAATIVLREAPGPLHVSEIYRRMAEGGFEFRGQHQLITLAVSLSRSKRFRKVAPGTFDLNPAYQQPAGQVA